jgi:hypothetical protein
MFNLPVGRRACFPRRKEGTMKKQLNRIVDVLLVMGALASASWGTSRIHILSEGMNRAGMALATVTSTQCGAAGGACSASEFCNPGVPHDGGAGNGFICDGGTYVGICCHE